MLDGSRTGVEGVHGSFGAYDSSDLVSTFNKYSDLSLNSRLDFYASRSSNLFKNISNVQPESLRIYMIVRT